MIQQPDKPLTPLELFQREIAMTREIRGRIEESRAYYLGRSSRASGQPLSEVVDPTRGPILKYFIETLRTINRTRFIERFCRTATFREFRQSSEATLEELRLLAIQLAMCLGVPGKTDRRRSVGQALKTSINGTFAFIDAKRLYRRGSTPCDPTNSHLHFYHQSARKTGPRFDSGNLKPNYRKTSI